MSAISKSIAELSPEERRALLGELLKKKTGEARVFQASFAQERMWLLDQLQPGTAVYNIPSAFRITVPINLAALERTINEIVRRHEALRTTFANRAGEVVQKVWPSLNLPFPVTDLSHLPESEREQAVQRLALEEAQRPFDLSIGPLLRTSILNLGTNDLVLLITMHHIVSDGWSLGVFFREMGILYQAFALGQPSPLPDLPVQYADFAHWQRERLQGAVLEEHVSYWRQRLAGAPSLLKLSWDKPRPQVQSFRGGIQPLSISASLMRLLISLGKREGATLFMAILAVFKTLLHRYSGECDLVVGSAIANRTRSELEGLIGFFTNTLVLRTEVTGDLTFRELLRRVRDVTIGAYAHQDLPFEKLVEELQPERNLNRNPLFQVAFTFQHAPSQSQNSSSTSQSLPENPQAFTATSKFDLTLSLIETDAGLDGALEYSVDLFEAETISRMAEHLLVLLESLIAEPDKPLSELTILTEAERRQLLDEWNPPVATAAPDTTLHQLFEEAVARWPQAVAVEDDRDRLTYAELNERANKLARYMRATNLSDGQRVGILLDRSVEMIVAVLAVLKAGAGYVPLDPVYPQGRLSYMLNDAGVELLLTRHAVVEGFDTSDVSLPLRTIFLDSEQPEIEKHSGANGNWSVDAHALAYVIYTSGSSGEPKGVMINHQNVVRLFKSTEKWFNLNEDDVWTLFHSYAFDFSVWEIWGALLYGGRLVIVPYLVSRSPEEFYDLLVAHKVTVLNQTPSAFRQLISLEERRTSDAPLSLRLVIFGGEALDIQSLQPWFERHGDQLPRLVNMYGITETTVHVSYRPLTVDDARGQTGSMIGRPIPDLQMYLLDKHLQPVAIGIPGEIYVGGAGLSPGYLNRPELTAERLIPNPFNPSARLYKTGDLARYRPDGDIEYLGRTDHQIKIRGFRIEPGEIETLLKDHPAIEDAVVRPREVGPGDKRLIAYLVPHRQHAYAIRQLMQMKRNGHGEKTFYELPNGMVIAQKNKSETDFMFKEIFEQLTYFQNGITLPQDACILDVGANIGLFTLFMGRMCRDATIYAFEPIPAIFEILRTNVELYGLNVKLFNHGISNEVKDATFTYYPHVSAVSGFYGNQSEQYQVIRSFLINQMRVGEAALPEKEVLDELLKERLTSERFSCHLKTISDVIRENDISQIDLLKVDVEKSELDVLSGIEPADWSRIRQIVMEVHDEDNRVETITSLFESHGYKVVTTQDAMLADTGLFNIYALSDHVVSEPANLAEGKQSSWESETVLIRDLRDLLASKLPDYMLPADYVLLEQLPLTANGKLDLQALFAVEGSQAKTSSDSSTPRNKIEEVLVGIWSEILRVKQVGIDDNFFELGGHSLLATQALSRMHDTFQVDLHLRTLFEAPTIRELAREIARLQSISSQTSLDRITPIPRHLVTLRNGV